MKKAFDLSDDVHRPHRFERGARGRQPSLATASARPDDANARPVTPGDRRL